VRSLLRLLIHNWKLKLAAFALGMLLWITVSADQDTRRLLRLPVVVEVRDPEFELLDGPTPAEIDVVFAGPWRELFDLGINRPPVNLVVGSIREGVQDVTIEPQFIEVPPRRGISIVDVRPSTVRLTFQRLASAEVPVQLRVRSALRPDLALVDTLEAVPPRVRIFGPAARVRAVEAIATRPFGLPDEPGAFERRVPIDTTGLSELRLSSSEVVVTGRIERAVDAVLNGVPVQAPEGVLVLPGGVDVQLHGAESVVRALRPADVRVVVPPESIPAQLPAGGVMVPLRVQQLPAGVQAQPEPRAVRVTAAPPPAPPPSPAPDTGSATAAPPAAQGPPP
jgi:hypothetical protein